MQIWIRAYGPSPKLLSSRVRLWLRGVLNESLWPNIEISMFSFQVLKYGNQSQIRSSFLDCFSCFSKPSNSSCWKSKVCYRLQHEQSRLISEVVVRTARKRNSEVNILLVLTVCSCEEVVLHENKLIHGELWLAMFNKCCSFRVERVFCGGNFPLLLN